MAKPVIAVDVDDVLAASASAWIAHSNERWGDNLTVDDYQEDWATMWQVDHIEVRRRSDELFGAGLLQHFDPHRQAHEVLTRLSKDYTLVIATSRRTSAYDETLAWLNKHYDGIFKDVYMSGIFDADLEFAMAETKAELIGRIGADYLIDDQLKHCIGVAEAGVQAVLFGDYTWNQADELPTNVTRCKDWPAVGAYFDGLR